MSSEKRALESAVTLAGFEEVFADFLGGNVSLAQMRQCLLDVIASDADALPRVQAQIDAAMYSGRLPEQTWENLIAEIDHLVSENTPTEWSDDAEIIADEDEEPLLTFENDGPILFDEELLEPPVLVEPVLVDRADTPAQTLAQQEPVATKTPSPPAPQEEPLELSASTESTQPLPADSSNDLPPGTVLEDRFVLVSRIERGSMGTVYKALDQQRKDAGAEDPWVAIKLITADFSSHSAAADALKNEAKIGCRLKHPNIVCTHALHEDSEHLFISMEWLDGESLSQLLDRKRPHTIPREQALNIIEQLALGLAHAHAQGVVHADVKPGNVYIAQSGEIKLLDFGIARHGDDMPAANGLLARTPAYASCEVLEGGDTTSQDDLFSLAAVAYRVLAGKRPFGSANALEAEGEQREPVPVPGLAPQQWRALRAALAWRREHRSADVQSFITEFFGEEEIVLATPEPPVVSAVQPTTPVPQAPVPKPEVDINEPPKPVAVPVTLTATETAAESLDIDTLDEDEASGRGWLRPAIAATVVGLAIGAALQFSGGEPPSLKATSSNAPQRSAEPEVQNMSLASTEAESAAAIPAPADDGLRPDANLSMSPAGEELMAFMPGTGIAVAEQTAEPGSSKTDEVSAIGQTRNDEAEPPASASAVVATTAAAVVTESRQPEAGVERASAAADSGDSSDAENRPATNEPAAQDPEIPTRVAAASSVAVVAAQAEDEATGVKQTVAESPAAPEPEQSSKPPAEPERDTVELPAEPVLASTLSLAMVSPDSEPRREAAEQVTVPVPERVVAPDPEDYGPPGEFAPVQIEEVLLSTLKFDRFVEPKFPRLASKRDITGWVDLTFIVSNEGETSEIKVLAAEPGGVFEEAAVAAVERWRFKPRKVDGEAVASRTQIRLRFD